jgi:hypothetical protein
MVGLNGGEPLKGIVEEGPQLLVSHHRFTSIQSLPHYITHNQPPLFACLPMSL